MAYTYQRPTAMSVKTKGKGERRSFVAQHENAKMCIRELLEEVRTSSHSYIIINCAHAHAHTQHSRRAAQVHVRARVAVLRRLLARNQGVWFVSGQPCTARRGPIQSAPVGSAGLAGLAATTVILRKVLSFAPCQTMSLRDRCLG
jgi:hypothetical protein